MSPWTGLLRSDPLCGSVSVTAGQAGSRNGQTRWSPNAWKGSARVAHSVPTHELSLHSVGFSSHRLFPRRRNRPHPCAAHRGGGAVQSGVDARGSGEAGGSPRFHKVTLPSGPGWSSEFKLWDRLAVERILGTASAIDASLIVMPTAGHQGFLDAIRGSTTERVLQACRCPLLAVNMAAENHGSESVE